MHWGISKKDSENFTKECYGYEDITLRLYFEIAEKGCLEKLAKIKNVKKVILQQAWENILKRNSKENNNFSYELYFTTAQNYTLLVNEYNLIKACLLKLMIRADKGVIQLLKDRGYVIKMSSETAYLKSLEEANTRSNNLLTKIMTRRKELDRLTKNEQTEQVTLAKAISSVNTALKWPAVNEDTTLALYNEYKKNVIKQNNNGRNRQAGFNQR